MAPDHSSVADDRSVAINARATMRAQLAGVERYATALARRLPALQPDRYRVIAPRPRLAHRAGHAWEQLELPILARQAPLIYSPANLAPLLTAGRNVIVIHDTAPFATPESYSRPYRVYHRALALPLARSARHVITVSEFSKREIVEWLGVPPERVTVIAPGVNRDRFMPDLPAEATAAAAQQLGLTRPYVLAVGTASARKNHAVLNRAAVALNKQGVDLVVAGGGRDYLNGGGHSAPTLRQLGYVPDTLMPALYAGARALAMPSIHEGFGVPCIEAMASGTPVVAARAAALPEICAGAAVLVDPHDDEAFAQRLTQLAADPMGDAAQQLRQAGLARSASFSWDRAAAETDALLTTLLT